MGKFTKLNRKGFTLIELLAVIVILAVIMVIASTSVIGVMNQSKQSSLLDSAKSSADALTTAASESILTNSTTVYGLTNLLTGSSTSPVTLAMSTGGTTLTDYLDINSTDYNLASSYVSYDGTKITVCYTVGTGSSFYVSNAASKYTYKKLKNGTTQITIGNATTNTMWACSDGNASWTVTANVS